MSDIAGALGLALGRTDPEVQSYTQRMHGFLAQLDAWSAPVEPTNEDEYLAFATIRNHITALSCYTANTDHPENERVWALESRYGALQHHYNRRLELKHGPDRALARYLLWSYRFRDVDHRVAVLEARDRGLLRKNVDGRVFIVGITAKVGNNVFTVDRRGREYRQYCRTVGRQAISVRIPFENEDRARFLSSLAPLGEGFYETDVYDGKHGIRAIALRRSERVVVHRLLQASRHVHAPELVPTPPPPTVPLSPAGPAPAQAELFRAAA